MNRILLSLTLVTVILSTLLVGALHLRDALTPTCTPGTPGTPVSWCR